MRIENTQIVLENKQIDAEIQIFEKRDWQTIKSMYEQWVNLSNLSKEMRGRGINLPEVISEGVFCLEFECARFLGSSGGIKTSFDCLDLNLLKEFKSKLRVWRMTYQLLDRKVFGTIYTLFTSFQMRYLTVLIASTKSTTTLFIITE